MAQEKDKRNQNKEQFEHEDAFENYRKNFDTMYEASCMTMEIMKSIVNIQNQYMKQVFEDFGQMVRESSEAQSSSDYKDPSQHFKKAMESAFNHSNQIADILVNSTNHEFFKKAQETMNDNIGLFNNIMFKNRN